MTGRVVVGVDESEGSSAALRWAAREAELRNTTVLAVLAWSYLDQHPGAGGFDPAFTSDDAAAALDARVTAALPAERARLVHRHVVCDLPARALLEASAGQEMLVIGARGLGGFTGLLVGSVSQHCLHAATVPTVVVRNLHDHPGSGSIVAGVDGSDDSGRALAWAVDEARRRGCPLTVVHGYELPLRSHLSPRFSPEAMAAAAAALVDTMTRGVDGAGLDVTTTTSPTGPAQALIDASRDADLLVVGSRGRGAVRRLLLGSVATQVVHHAPCTVAVIPNHASNPPA